MHRPVLATLQMKPRLFGCCPQAQMTELRSSWSPLLRTSRDWMAQQGREFDWTWCCWGNSQFPPFIHSSTTFVKALRSRTTALSLHFHSTPGPGPYLPHGIPQLCPHSQPQCSVIINVSPCAGVSRCPVYGSIQYSYCSVDCFFLRGSVWYHWPIDRLLALICISTSVY